jgi:RNA-directed DNA polymerase
LANIALHGLAEAVQAPFPKQKCPRKGIQIPWKPDVIRYADDFVILHRDLDVLRQAEQIAAEWLKGIGLEMKPSKTRITHTIKAIDGPAGFDFLGFNFRQYPRGRHRCSHSSNGRPVGFTTSIRPSKESQKRFLRKVREIVHSNRINHQIGLIRLLNPVIRGWGSYFSTVVSKDTFGKMDSLIFEKLWSWAKRRHPNKSRHWIAHKYWQFNEHGWTFGCEGKITLHKLSSIPIKRHIVVQKHKSPFDGDAFYWGTRTGRSPGLPNSLSRLLRIQRGCCPECGLFFKPGDQMVVRRHQGWTDGQKGKAVLLHEHCLLLSDAKCAMTKRHIAEEPDEGKLSRPVLKTSANREVRA